MAYAAFHPRLDRLVTAGSDGRLRAWDVATGLEVGPSIDAGGPVEHVAFDRDGKRLLAAYRPSWARVWDASTGSPLTPPLPQDLDGAWGMRRRPGFRPDGERVVTTRAGGWTIWDPDTGAKVLGPVAGWDLHEVAWSPDGGRLIVSSGNSTVASILKASDGSVIRTLGHPRSTYYAAFSPDGKKVLTDSNVGLVHLWDAASGRELWRGRCLDYIRWLGFSPDGTLALAVGDDGTARAWELEPRPRTAEAIDPSKGDSEPRPVNLGGRKTRISSRDRRVTATYRGEPPEVIELEHRGRTPPLAVAIRLDRAPEDVWLGLDGQRMVTLELAGPDPIFRGWDTTTGREVGPPFRLQGRAGAWVISADGRRAAIGGLGGRVRIWDFDLGRLVTPPIPLPDGLPLDFGTEAIARHVSGVALTPDGRRVVACLNAYGLIAAWDVESGRSLWVRPGLYRGFRHEMEVSGDGRRLLLGSSGALTHVLDVETGRMIGPPIRYGTAPTSSRTRSFRATGSSC